MVRMSLRGLPDKKKINSSLNLFKNNSTTECPIGSFHLDLDLNEGISLNLLKLCSYCSTLSSRFTKLNIYAYTDHKINNVNINKY